MANAPFIAVVVPLCNKGRYIERCLMWDYRGSWLPSRLAKAIAALPMPSDAYLMLGAVWRRASGGQVACPQQR